MHLPAPTVLLASALLLLPACGSSSADPGPTCDALAGLWHAALDSGGPVAYQDWTVTQSECSLQVAGSPVDAYGIAIGPSGASGWTSPGFFRLVWITDATTCRHTNVIEGSASATSLTGTVYRTVGSNGTGYCPGGSSTSALTATR